MPIDRPHLGHMARNPLYNPGLVDDDRTGDLCALDPEQEGLRQHDRRSEPPRRGVHRGGPGSPIQELKVILSQRADAYEEPPSEAQAAHGCWAGPTSARSTAQRAAI